MIHQYPIKIRFLSLPVCAIQPTIRSMRVAPFMITGVVQKGAQRGRALGYPTINMRLTQKLTHGVYVSETDIAGTWYPSATFIGAAETFGSTEVKVETYILGFTGDLYDKEISVRLHSFLRPNIKFSTVSELLKQIKHDISQVRKFMQDGVV